MPDKWLTSGYPDLLNPHADGNLRDSDDLLEREDLLTTLPKHIFVRHAVGAAEVAPIGYRYPEIGVASAESVDKSVHRSTFQNRSIMTRKPYTAGRQFIGRLPIGTDIIAAITRIVNDETITVGSVSVHGTVSEAVVTIYDQHQRTPVRHERVEGMEIAAMSGTISTFKGRSMVRLNGLLAALDGSLLGGTIALGTIAFDCEVVISESIGGTITRDFDEETGLAVWKENAVLLRG